jgi:hypothetical protein
MSSIQDEITLLGVYEEYNLRINTTKNSGKRLLGELVVFSRGHCEPPIFIREIDILNKKIVSTKFNICDDEIELKYKLHKAYNLNYILGEFRSYSNLVNLLIEDFDDITTLDMRVHATDIDDIMEQLNA